MTEESILLDTNVIIDFTLGLAWAIAINERPPDPVRTGNEVLERLSKFLKSLKEYQFKILMTKKTYDEFFRVMRRYLRTHSKLLTRRFLQSLESLLKCYSDVINVIDTHNDEPEVEERLKEYGIRFPREDLHVITCAAILKPKYVCSDEDAVVTAIENLLRREGAKMPAFGGLGKFLDNLIKLGVISIKERILIGYFAYKYQRIPYVLFKIFNLQAPARDRELKEWEEYARKRLQRYIPLKLIIQLKSF